jgi:hypothetical protein
LRHYTESAAAAVKVGQCKLKGLATLVETAYQYFQLCKPKNML